MSLPVALVVVLALATPAAAEINMADSVEWQTIDSDVVVRGFVTHVKKRKLPSGEWYEVTLKIAESIKGGVKQSLRFGVQAGMGKPERWRKDKTDLLLFLVAGKELAHDEPDFAKFPYALRESRGSSHSAIELGTLAAYTATFDALTRPTAVLATVRGAVRSTATASHRVDVPWDTPAMKALYGGSAVWMHVPVDAALEQLAIGWLADASVSTREEGAKALAHFKSAANIARMTKLLADPGFSESSSPKRRFYIVRAAAHAALEAWHVAHAKPILEE